MISAHDLAHYCCISGNMRTNTSVRKKLKLDRAGKMINRISRKSLHMELWDGIHCFQGLILKVLRGRSNCASRSKARLLKALWFMKEIMKLLFPHANSLCKLCSVPHCLQGLILEVFCGMSMCACIFKAKRLQSRIRIAVLKSIRSNCRTWDPLPKTAKHCITLDSFFSKRNQ